MGYGIGAAKYLVMGLLFNPLSFYIFGGTLLWFLDVLTMLGSENLGQLALNLLLIHFGIPSSVEDALFQMFVGLAVATILWLVGSLRYASRRGWR
jgi:hypothetical protein